MYDWKDKNDDSEIASDKFKPSKQRWFLGETVQELRVSKPTEYFENEPIVGVYPFP
ncbi:MAG: hypothetical protein Ct9H300mP17_16950 [Candidatus Nitrosopelagicus sp.]|nr:MAG: hypothetical protein Ct9H300mP17_16950 [Candidatus Nitrosopelagicus sp.]